MTARTLGIAKLNDLLRTTFLTGRIAITEGIQALSERQRSEVITAVREFSAFTEDNDPYGQHDFGAIERHGTGTVFWKIDYYNRTLDGGSEDPADPSKTTRVLTIMLASEY